MLIHAAAGGVGLAAVHLARRTGAEIFATAGSPEKRAFLRELGVPHVLDSRSLAFADQILALTGGGGVQVVLNSLAGEFVAASLSVLGSGGRFLELGKRDGMSAERVAASRPDVKYYRYDLGALAQADETLLRPMLRELIRAWEDGSLPLLPVRGFALERAADAFRFMAQARHIGKLVLVPTRTSGVAISPDATYWITGGLGALGLATARWLASCGAGTLVLTGRHPPNQSAATAIRDLAGAGIDVQVLPGDVGDPATVRALLDRIGQTLPPLRGIVHAAGSLADAILPNQSWEKNRDVLHGKAHGAWWLHHLTRDLPLDFLIFYSAAGTLLGPRDRDSIPRRTRCWMPSPRRAGEAASPPPAWRGARGATGG